MYLKSHLGQLIITMRQTFLYKKECVCPSVRPAVSNAKCVQIIKGYFLRSKVAEIRHEDRCSGKFDAHFLKILLKIILTEIISILCNFNNF